MKKKFLSAIVAAACLTSVSAVSMPAVNAAVDGNLEYKLVDFDKDGRLDYAVITGCDSTATSLTIPATFENYQVRGIEDDAFANNKVLEEFTVSDNNLYFTQVGGVLFSKDSETLVCYPSAKKQNTKYTIPSAVKYIANNAFINNKTLTEVVLPSSVNSIGSSAFEECVNLEKVSIPSSVESIGRDAFWDTKLLENQIKNEQGPIYYADSWIIYSDSNIETVMSDSKAIKVGTVGIAGGAFTEHQKLSLVDIPASIRYISEFAFYDCDELTSVKFPSAIKIIGQGAFENCDRLTELTLPDTLGSLGAEAFKNCTKLARVNIPTSIKNIAASLFEGSAIVAADLPANIESIESRAFANCPNLHNVTIRNKDCAIVDQPDTISNSGTLYNGTITGYSGSTAQTYTNSLNRTFDSLGGNGELPSTGFEQGDANHDGAINVMDASFIARKLSQKKVSELPESADYNGDNKINVMDASAIARDLASGKLKKK